MRNRKVGSGLKEAGLQKWHENTSDYTFDTMTARFFAVQRKL